jgi:hypothetical protein
MNESDPDGRSVSADRREEAQDVREGLLDRWERVLTARAIAAGLFDDDQAAAQEAARGRRAAAHRLRREDAEARHAATIRRRVEEVVGTAPLPTTSGGDRPNWSIDHLLDLAVHGGAIADTLTVVLAMATDTVGVAAGVSASLSIDGRLAPAASSIAWAGALDAAQLAARRGPLLDAMEHRGAVDSGDLFSDPRWHLGDAVGPDGHRGVVSAAIVVGGTAEGALTVYTEPAAAFEPRDVAAVRLVVAQASLAIGWGLERLTHQAQTEAWERALASRDQIGQAKGILMEQGQLSAEQAFQLLRSTSQRLNRKVRDVAEHLVAHRVLPE